MTIQPGTKQLSRRESWESHVVRLGTINNLPAHDGFTLIKALL